MIETLGNHYINPTLSLFFVSQTQTLKLSLFLFQSLKLSLSLSLSHRVLAFFSTMARFSFVALVLMAVLVGSSLAQSPSQSPSKSPTQAPAPKASAPSPTVRKTPVPALSPTVVNLNRLLVFFLFLFFVDFFFLNLQIWFFLENPTKEKGLKFYLVIVL